MKQIFLLASSDAKWLTHKREEVIDQFVPKEMRDENLREQAVLLEAIAAAPLKDELCLQRSKIERHRPAHEGVEILERNRRRVKRMQRPERF